MICTPWFTEADLVGCPSGCEAGTVTAEEVAEIITAASEFVFLKTGQQFHGSCYDTVRPCACGSGSCGTVTPIHTPAGWLNVCGGCGFDRYCNCAGNAILLPQRPVSSIASVMLDGALFTEWRLDSPGWLIRTDGAAWPCCQDIRLATTEPNTWEISYFWGVEPPAMILRAARTLASELVKGCAGDAHCRIPVGAVQITRRGVNYDMGLHLAAGQTGLWEVDLVIDAINPALRTRRARVYSPDDTRFVRTPGVS